MLNERNILLEEDGIEEEILVDEEIAVTKAMWGDIGGNIENQTDLKNALDAKQDSLTEAQLNAVNSGITAEKVTTYDGYADQIASKADQSALNTEATTREQADTALGTRIDNEALARQQADNGLQTQIDAITSKSDVVDVVANYAALQAYDTSTLGNNDVVKVLDDETHEDALTYYRWSTTTQTWSYIGQEAPYYSKGQMDVMLQGKQDKLTAGANIQIENGTIRATDTTYTAGNGLNLNGTEFSADTTVLATKSDLEDYYTKPETDNLLAPKLEAEVVAELPTTGDEGKLYLTPKAHTTQTATGNPITATVTEEAGAIESFQLDGDAFQQSYEGKNLFNMAAQPDIVINASVNASEDSITINYQDAGASDNYFYGLWIYEVGSDKFLRAGQTYTLSFSDISVGSGATPSGRVLFTTYATSGTNPNRNLSGANYPDTSVTFTVPSDATLIGIVLYAPRGDSQTYTGVQLEAGSTATSYEPYVGGTPSPNPDYPQPIQTVTGEQTVSINGTDYPIDLGTIELCKLDTYQDYIYKDGSEWKVHKATAKAKLTTQIAWSTGSFSTQKRIYASDSLIFGTEAIRPSDNVYKGALMSDYFTNVPVRDMLQGTADGIGISSSGYVSIRDSSKATSADLLNVLANNDVAAIAALATPTDTTITDQTLIAQLEAVANARLASGANTISNSATGDNLAGDLEISYYGFNPRNRYDKWLWLDINNEYEQIGS